jgi:hypothetical protein
MTMARIFINFRNYDGDWAALAMRNTLAERFGAREVFLSSFSIQLAAHFEDELLRHARDCDVMLALVGPRWLTITGADGQPKLGAADDWVCREIATALAARRRVVPVLLSGAGRLRAGDLPPAIAGLAALQGCRLNRPQYFTDIDGLERDLRALIPGLTRGPAMGSAPAGFGVKVEVGESSGKVYGFNQPAGVPLLGETEVRVHTGHPSSTTEGIHVRDDPKKAAGGQPGGGPDPAGGATGSRPE